MSSKRYPEEFKIEAVSRPPNGVVILWQTWPSVLACRNTVSINGSSCLASPRANAWRPKARHRDPAPEGRTETGDGGARHPKKAAAYFAKESR